MVAVPNGLSLVPVDMDGSRNFPTSVNAQALGAGVAETITIPALASFVRIVATADVYVKANGAAAVPGDTTDGSAAELLRYGGGDDGWYQLAGVASLSVICVGAAIVTASFYTN